MERYGVRIARTYERSERIDLFYVTVRSPGGSRQSLATYYLLCFQQEGIECPERDMRIDRF